MLRRTTGKNSSSRSRRFAVQCFCALMVAVATGLPAQGSLAQLANCEAALQDAPSSSPDGIVFKLLLDELALAGVPDSIEPDVLVQSLRVKLLDNVSKIGLELDSVHVVVCLGRSPVNPIDIKPSATRLAVNNVILEVWGFYDGDEVVFSNAVIPLLASTGADWASAGPFYNDSFTYDGSQPHLRFLKQIVRESLHLRAYAAVGIATRSLRVGDFDRARRFFCRASLLLTHELGAAGDPERKRLTVFVEHMSVAVIDFAVEARQAGRYDGRLGTAQLPRGAQCETQTS